MLGHVVSVGEADTLLGMTACRWMLPTEKTRPVEAALALLHTRPWRSCRVRTSSHSEHASHLQGPEAAWLAVAFWACDQEALLFLSAEPTLCLLHFETPKNFEGRLSSSPLLPGLVLFSLEERFPCRATPPASWDIPVQERNSRLSIRPVLVWRRGAEGCSRASTVLPHRQLGVKSKKKCLLQPFLFSPLVLMRTACEESLAFVPKLHLEGTDHPEE